MTTKLPEVWAFALAALCVVAVVILAALHTDIPSFLEAIALAAVGAGGGLAVPARARAADPPAPAPAADVDDTARPLR